MYQESVPGRRVMAAQSATCWFHPASASAVGSMVSWPPDRRSTRASVTNSTCCSMATAMFASTDGLPGPVIMNRLGKPSLMSPR